MHTILQHIKSQKKINPSNLNSAERYYTKMLTSALSGLFDECFLERPQTGYIAEQTEAEIEDYLIKFYPKDRALVLDEAGYLNVDEWDIDYINDKAEDEDFKRVANLYYS